MTKARYMVIIVFVGWRENYFKMLLWLSRQSTSLVRTRSPVRIWLTAPCNPNTLDAMRKNRMASVFSKDFEDKILYCKRRKREGTRPNFFTFPYISSLDCLSFAFPFGYPLYLSCFLYKDTRTIFRLYEYLSGGDEGDRTLYLLNAIQALSQGIWYAPPNYWLLRFFSSLTALMTFYPAGNYLSRRFLYLRLGELIALSAFLHALVYTV